MLGLTQLHSNRAREERALAAEKRFYALSQKPTTKGKFRPSPTFRRVLKGDRSPLTELPPDDDASDSGSDEEVEFAKTEGDDDRRKTLLDSMQQGDSSLDQLRKQSKLDDYAGFFHLPTGQDEDKATTSRDPQQADHTKGPSATSSEVIDLSLSTDEEGEDDRPGDAAATTSSVLEGGCDIQLTVTSTSVTGKPDRATDGVWACPICTLYGPSSPFTSSLLPSPSPALLRSPHLPVFVSHSHPLVSIPHRRAPIDH